MPSSHPRLPGERGARTAERPQNRRAPGHPATTAPGRSDPERSPERGGEGQRDEGGRALGKKGMRLKGRRAGRLSTESRQPERYKDGNTGHRQGLQGHEPEFQGEIRRPEFVEQH